MPSLATRGGAVLPLVAALNWLTPLPGMAEASGPLVPDRLVCSTPSPGELAASSDIAEARSNLAASGAIFAEGWTLGAVAGPRRVEGPRGRENETDVAAEASAPILADRASRARLANALAEAERILPAAARLEARFEVRSLAIDAWAAERIETLRQISLAAADEWLELARLRAAEGADAPYQSELVAVERREASIALLAARAVRRAAWSVLAARCDLPDHPATLDAAPSHVASGEDEALRSLASRGIARRAVELRAELDRAEVAFETARARSRWLVRGEAAREGDEEVARLGFAFRIPRSGEAAALAVRRETDVARIARDAELESAALSSRLEAALALRGPDGSAEATIEADAGASIEAIRRALAALVAEGRSRASEVLPLRRQLLLTEIAEIERAAELAKAAAEIELLTAEVLP